MAKHPELVELESLGFEVGVLTAIKRNKRYRIMLRIGALGRPELDIHIEGDLAKLKRIACEVDKLIREVGI